MDSCKKQIYTAKYTVQLFQWYITPSSTSRPIMPDGIHIQLGLDCTHIAELAATAFLNPSMLPLKGLWEILTMRFDILVSYTTMGD